MRESFDHGSLRQDMAKEHLSQAQIEATYQRVVDTIKRMELMEKKAEPFLKRQAQKEGKSSYKFFFNADDYYNLSRLSDYAVDPGNSYLAIDNEQFLQANYDFQKFMTNQEKADAKNARNKILTDPKRWNDKAEQFIGCVVSDYVDLREGLEADHTGLNTLTKTEKNKLKAQDERWEEKKKQAEIRSAKEKQTFEENERFRIAEEARKKREAEIADIKSSGRKYLKL